LAASFVDAACARGERSLYFAFEESAAQVIRNMASVGIDLQRHRDAGLLKFEAARPSLYGFEMHLARMHRDIEAYDPSVIVVDPISAFRGPAVEVNATLLRLADICKSRGITALFTSLSSSGDTMTDSERNVSSLMDIWIALTDVEANGERNRVLSLLKARGMNHSKQLREYHLTDHGIEMVPVYVGPDGVLTGTARVAQEAREREAEQARQDGILARRRMLERRRLTVERQIAELRAELESEEAEVTRMGEQDEVGATDRHADRSVMSTLRGGL
jgi:circadian clock protein KaiC